MFSFFSRRRTRKSPVFSNAGANSLLEEARSLFWSEQRGSVLPSLPASLACAQERASGGTVGGGRRPNREAPGALDVRSRPRGKLPFPGRRRSSQRRLREGARGASCAAGRNERTIQTKMLSFVCFLVCPLKAAMI